MRATDASAIADRWLERLRASWTDGPPAQVTIGTFRDTETLQRWHPDHTIVSHRALVDAMTVRLATMGIDVILFQVTLAAYDRWRGRRPDTPENRARYIGQRGANIPWRLGVKIGMAEGGRGSGRPRGGAMGWCAIDLDGYRASGAGVMRLDR